VRFAFKLIRITVQPLKVKEEASVELPRSAATMWAYMWDPASSADFNDETEAGLRLPGRPLGLGEIQVFLDRTAGVLTAAIHEVVSFEPDRRAVTRSLDGDHPSYAILTIEPLGPGSCRLTQTHWIDFPAGVEAGAPRRYRDGARAQLSRMMTRLTELAPQLPA